MKLKCGHGVEATWPVSTELLSVDTEIHTQESVTSKGHSATDGREPEATFPTHVEDVPVNTVDGILFREH